MAKFVNTSHISAVDDSYADPDMQNKAKRKKTSPNESLQRTSRSSDKRTKKVTKTNPNTRRTGSSIRDDTSRDQVYTSI